MATGVFCPVPSSRGNYSGSGRFCCTSGGILCAFIGTLFSDQLFFYQGRRHSHALLQKRPKWVPRLARVNMIIDHYRIAIILTFRFWYGLRIATPVALGMSKVGWSQFIVLNRVGSIVWAVVIGYAGYLFGHALQGLLGDMMRYEALLMSGLALIGFLLWGWHLWRNRATIIPAPVSRETSTIANKIRPVAEQFFGLFERLNYLQQKTLICCVNIAMNKVTF